MKRFILWALVCVLCLSLVACTQEESTQPATTEAPTEAPTETPTESPTEASTAPEVHSEPFDWDAVASMGTGSGCGGGDNTIDE